MNTSTSARPWEGKNVTVVQHVSFEDLGSFSAVLDDLGLLVRYRQAGVDELGSSVSTADLLVVLGGPIGVYEEEAYPFLVDEVAALGQRLRAGQPTLGICLGAQLIAKALGARVHPGKHQEIGFSELTFSTEGMKSPLKHLAGFPVLHWHGDTFDLPEGARRLASTAWYPNQAFSIGSNVLALQFHPEIEAARFERWLIGHACQLAKADIDIPALRADNVQLGRGLEEAGARVLTDWLGGVHWS